MTGQEALRIIDRLLEQHQRGSLKTIQAAIVSQVWKGDSYKTIASELGYEPEYIKQAASHLWQLLSAIVGQKVSKSNLCSILQRYQTSLTITNWGDALDVSHFYGRETNLEILRDWIVDRRCRVVGIFGWGGIGKTALSVKLARQLESQFEYVIWRSLRQAIDPKDLLDEILPILVGAEVQESSIDLLMQQLRQKRCLLVFDNVESILQAGDRNGCYLAGYEGYGEIFQRVSDESHQSCLVITSREKPDGITLRAGANLPVRSMQLTGLEINAAQHILIDKGVTAPLIEQHNLINYVDGNPLVIKLVATSIQNIFNGDIQAFLAQGTAVFGNLWELLDRQFDRLSALQQRVLYWLAINREGVTPARLQAELIPTVTLPILLATLETLHDRSLIETTIRGLTQQPVIMEYVTERLIQQIDREIISGKLRLFCSHALMEAQTQDYLRDAQIKLILQPLIDRLLTHFQQQSTLEHHLNSLLGSLRDRDSAMTGYAAGNILNLFCHLKTDIQGYDCSRLFIRQAYLPNATLHDVDFTGSQIGQTIFAETFGGILSISYSPDGQILATSDTKGEIQLWDALTFSKIAKLRGHQTWTWTIDFSANSQYLVSGSTDCTVRLWDVATNECLYTYREHTDAVNTVAISPVALVTPIGDRQIIASAAEDSTIHLWWIVPGETAPEHQIVLKQDTRVKSLAFSPDGLILASGGEDCTVSLWEVKTGKCLAGWSAHQGLVSAIAFSPNGESISTASYDRTIKIWSVDTQSCRHTFTGHQQPVSSISFSPDGQQLVSSSFDRTIKLWDTDTGQCLKTLLGHRSLIWTVAFDPNGQNIASGGDDREIVTWDLKLGRRMNTTIGYSNAVLTLSIHADGQYLASGGEDRSIRIWNIERGQIVHTIDGHTNRVLSTQFTADGNFLATGSFDYTIKLWDWRSGNCLQTFRGHKNLVWQAIFSHPNLPQSLISSSYDQTIKIWDIHTGECLNTLIQADSSVIALACSPVGDRQLLASGDFNGTIELWDLSSRHSTRQLLGHQNSVWSVSFSHNGKYLLSASYDETIKLWSVETGECLQTLQGHQGALLNAKFSPDDRFIISGGFDSTLKVWDVHTGKCLQTLAGHSGLIYTLEIAKIQLSGMDSPKPIAFTGSLDETIKVWDLEAAECLATWKSLRPYEGMQIDKIQGLTSAQQATLQALGAITRLVGSSAC